MKRNRYLLPVAAASLASEAFARAGGGEKYKSAPQESPSSNSYSTQKNKYYSSTTVPSSGFSSSKGSSGGSLASTIGSLFVLLVILYILKKLKSHPLVTAAKVNSVANNSALDRLRADDPAFSFEDFSSRVSKAFVETQNAWSAGNMEAARHFFTDGVYERLTLSLDQMRKIGQSNRLENIKVESVSIMDYAAAGHFGVLSVAIAARGQDITTHKSGQTTRSADESFIEIWTFVRKLSAKTSIGKAGLLEKACPACGAPIENSGNIRCKSCSSIIKSGEHDWVLSEITQASEVAPDRSAHILDMAANAGLTINDPEFCGQALEDNATVMFVRYIRARTEQNIALAQKCCTADCISKLQTSDQKIVDNDVAIGSVSIERFWSEAEMINCGINVAWSSQRSGESQATNRRGHLVLTRHRSAKSNFGVGIINCKACGAPDDGKASNSCVYCGRVHADPKQDWLLAKIDLG